ncbi:MAG: GDP-L-fucose synthase [Pseudomonadota bacterium]
MNPTDKIYVAGHRGLVGSALVRKLESLGYTRVIGRSSRGLDLKDQACVAAFFKAEQPDYVFLAAARVGGIHANATYPAEFIYQNLMIQSNILHQSWVTGVKRVLFLGSSCIYPKMACQPIREEYLMTGALEPTNSPYAVAKIAGIEMCWAYNRQYGTSFIPVMPTNLYGPFDNFDLENSHVLPALIRRFHEAKQNGDKAVTVWGTGSPMREFLHVDDLADACVFLMNRDTVDGMGGDRLLVNIGTGVDVTIRELAGIVKEITGFEGELRFDPSRPDGTPRKLLDVSRMRSLGWEASVPLKDGLVSTYRWFTENL